MSNHVGLSLKRITDLLSKRPEEILLKICNPTFGFDNYLEPDSLGIDLIRNLIKLVEKILECNTLKHKLKEIMHKFVDSKLLQTHVLNLISKPISMVDNVYDTNLIKSILNITCLIIELDSILVDKLDSVHDKIEILATRRVKDKSLEDQFENRLFKLSQEAKKTNESRRNYKTFKNIDCSNLEPPEDFTKMNIIPTLNDILNDQHPFLRKNITNGAYKSVHHYLDVQFRLLREDYLQPLRDGIFNFRKIIKEANITDYYNSDLNNDVRYKLRKIDTLNVFFDVKLNQTVLNHMGLAFRMKWNTKILQKQPKINWENSKKLMFGSLLCFSSDLFQNECLIGIVSERSFDLLENNMITVKFEFGTENNDIDTDFINDNIPSYGKNYIMLETSAYFESYKHVLEALVSFKSSTVEEDFPFKEHIIDNKNDVIQRPKYLTNVSFDFRPIVDSKKKIIYDRRNGTTSYEFSNQDYEKCILTNEFQWPKADNMRLDDSQYSAVKLALENRLALIQGPPGTGKTFIGVKIVELLLHNKKLWWNKPGEPHRPILMICYTNHALDQFLEYCIDECKLNSGIVRVGGRCKSDHLAPFLLSNVKRNLKSRRLIDHDIHRRITDQCKLLEKIKSNSDDLTKRIKKLVDHECILSMNVLKDFIDSQIYDQLKSFNSELEDENNPNKRCSEDFTLLEWLGLFEIDDYYDLNEDFAGLNLADEQIHNENQDDIVEIDVKKEDEIEIENELLKKLEELEELNKIASNINDERMLEEDFEIFKQIVKADQIRRDDFDLFMYQEDIKEMLITFNHHYGSEVLNYLVKTNALNIWQEAQSRRKRRRKNKRKNNGSSNSSLLDKFIRETLDDIFYSIDDEKNEPNLESPIDDIWLLEYEQRAKLYSKWCKLYIHDLKKKIVDINREYNQEASKLKELRLQEDSSVMKDAFIIAMTTTGSSRYHNILKDIAPRIVIVEEAAEVFEAHIVSSLSKKCEHLILIGDHIQLRPNPAVYKLAKDFELDVSLFERLVKNDTKKVTLLCQHRSRPEISRLMKHFYKESIENYHSVLNFENVMGLKTNIFFMNHSHPEQSLNEGQSKQNEFEALFISEFCEYLIKQKQFQESQITILSMYLGQMIKLRLLMKYKGLRNVKVMTVDNYQGEENDIIILSLVRSNKNNSIGFLSTPNRVCVALSRARKGFFCIGNLELMRENNEKWNNIINDMEKSNTYGNSIILTCGRHPKNDIEACEPEDFVCRPDGGCKLTCDFRLKCGHSCSLKCHPFDVEHIDIKCRKPCDKQVINCNHKCKQLCSHSGLCSICSVEVTKTVNECGHSIKIRCDRLPEKSDCYQPCTKTLSCGHLCTKSCGQDCGECEKLILVDSVCKHSNKKLEIPCKNLNKIWLYQNYCKEKCNQILDCNHVCPSKKCCGFIHAQCEQNCDRILLCGHKSQEPCSEPTQCCNEICENKCFHSSCKLDCSDMCIPCIEICRYQCDHLKCKKKCWELCDRKPCNEPCEKILKCSHKCIGFCGEPCPRLCRFCDKDKLNAQFFGTENHQTSRYVLLVDCKHVFESVGLEKWLESNYNLNDEKKLVKLPRCPKCSAPIRRTLRYSNYYKEALRLIENIKLKQYGNEIDNFNDQLDLVNEIENHNSKMADAKSEDTHFLCAIFKELYMDKSKNARLNRKYIYSRNILASYKNTWNIFKRCHDLMKKVTNDFNSNQKDHINCEIRKVKWLLFDSKEKIVNLILNEQRLKEVLCELERIDYVINYYATQNKTDQSKCDSSNLKIKGLVENLGLCLVNKITRFDLSAKSDCDKLFGEMKKLNNQFETDIEETLTILKSKQFEEERWVRCSNGHVFYTDYTGRDIKLAECTECYFAGFQNFS